MSRTFIHTLNGKFNNGLLEKKDIPVRLWKYWNRKNFWTGRYRSLRKEKISDMNLSEIDTEINIY